MRGPKEKPHDTKVKFYSGYKGQETPASIVIDDTEYSIDKILSQQRVCDQKTGEISEIFECKTGKKHIWIKISGSSVSVMTGKLD